MSQPFLGQITMVAFDFAPRGYAQCDGLFLPISQNQSLFTLLGTTYGGDGRTGFRLPDLRGRVPIHRADLGSDAPLAVRLGEQIGEERNNITAENLPSHSHAVRAFAQPAKNPGANSDRMLAISTTALYGSYTAGNVKPMSGSMMSSTYSSLNADKKPVAHQSIPNMMPFQGINFCIALQGDFPPRD